MKHSSIQAFHLDMKVAQYRPDYLAALFPKLHEAGYDIVIFEIENKVRLDSIGNAAWCEAFSKGEFSAILENCRNAGLKAIPLIQTYAHLEWLLTHDPFHKLRELPGIAFTLCPLKAESQDFLGRYIDEVSELFGNPEFIHLGGDETTYMGACPDCAKVVQTGGKGMLYAQHMGQIACRTLHRGSRPLLWADMVLAHPECLAAFPKEVVWVDWHYEMTPEGPESTYLWGEKGPQKAMETSETFRKTFGSYAFDSSGTRYRSWFYADYLLDQGFDVLIAPAASCAGSHAFLPSFDRAANVASACLKLQSQPRLLGQIVTSWAMRLPALETQWPLLRLPAALRSASASSDWNATLLTVCEESFGVSLPGFLEHWEKVSRSFWWAESHHGFEWETGYTGQPPSLQLLLAQRLREGLSLSEEIAKVEMLLHDYAATVQQQTTLLAGNTSDNLPMRFWRLGSEAIQLRAREYLLYLHSQEGSVDTAKASEVLRQTQTLLDQWRNLLARIYLPAGVLLHQSLIYGETMRLLPKVTWGRFSKVTFSDT